jgi:hypothetical protein
MLNFRGKEEEKKKSSLNRFLFCSVDMLLSRSGSFFLHGYSV